MTHRSTEEVASLVRIGISCFIVVLLGVAGTGWVWTGGHQAPRLALASRFVLTLCMVAGLIGLAAMWRRRPSRR